MLNSRLPLSPPFAVNAQGISIALTLAVCSFGAKPRWLSATLPHLPGWVTERKREETLHRVGIRFLDLPHCLSQEPAY
jgi:hypothetical protein